MVRLQEEKVAHIAELKAA
jgi:hypothetical protein